jgi:hypothetical protein
MDVCTMDGGRISQCLHGKVPYPNPSVAGGAPYDFVVDYSLGDSIILCKKSFVSSDILLFLLEFAQHLPLLETLVIPGDSQHYKYLIMNI